MLIVEMCVCVLDISYFIINESVFRKAIIAFYSIWCWELNHRAESSSLLVGTIYAQVPLFEDIQW